MSNLNA